MILLRRLSSLFRVAVGGAAPPGAGPWCGTVTGPRPCVSAVLVIPGLPLETFFPFAPRVGEKKFRLSQFFLVVKLSCG